MPYGGGFPRRFCSSVNVGIDNPDGAETSTGCTRVEVYFPAGASSISFIEATQLFRDRTLEQIAKIAKAMECVERTLLIAVSAGNISSVGIYLPERPTSSF